VVNLAFGIMFIWLGAGCLWLATHNTDASSPWQAYMEVIDAIRKGTS
jgi:hypothetical protein